MPYVMIVASTENELCKDGESDNLEVFPISFTGLWKIIVVFVGIMQVKCR